MDAHVVNKGNSSIRLFEAHKSICKALFISLTIDMATGNCRWVCVSDIAINMHEYKITGKLVKDTRFIICYERPAFRLHRTPLVTLDSSILKGKSRRNRKALNPTISKSTDAV